MVLLFFGDFLEEPPGQSKRVNLGPVSKALYEIRHLLLPSITLLERVENLGWAQIELLSGENREAVRIEAGGKVTIALAERTRGEMRFFQLEEGSFLEGCVVGGLIGEGKVFLQLLFYFADDALEGP
jgi:hypothetical protein